MNHVDAEFFSDATPEVRWNVEGATLDTALNVPYVARVDIRAELLGTDPLDLLGSSASLILRRDLTLNVYAGLISQVRVRHDHDGHPAAQVVVEPALAALRHGRDSRIFQEKTVPEILEEVLAERLGPYGREAVVELTRAYPKREYTVQYQESDFDFVHRLMEEEGIVYHFEPDEQGVEVLTLLDQAKQHVETPAGILEYSSVRTGAGLIQQEYVRSFEPVSRVVATEVRTRHFDWTHPSVLVEGEDASPREGLGPDGASLGPPRETYQHDEQLTKHRYANPAYTAYDVEDQNQLMRDVQARDARRLRGESAVCALRAGHRFSLNGHPHPELNEDYVLIAVTHTIGAHAHRAKGDDDNYLNRFVCVPSTVLYRPRRTRARPRVHGLQTAIVTGPPGEEIHTDEHGRVKVQFHWDRRGEMNDKTTCWMRCMQTWSGNGWGAFVLPRVGMEVVVSFLDGDLDRPLVTGCVYNGDNALPYPQPDRKMVSTFKTNSYPGGEGYNELRFDDTKGDEEIWIHGEKDWNTVIENDLDRKVFHDETQLVSNNRRRTVGVDETVNVGANRTKSVGANEALNVGANRTRNVGNDETITIGRDRKETVMRDEEVRVVRHRKTRVGLNESLGAGETLELKCGASSILLEKDGTITITGVELKFTASGDYTMKGGMIYLN